LASERAKSRKKKEKEVVVSAAKGFLGSNRGDKQLGRKKQKGKCERVSTIVMTQGAGNG